MDTKGQGKDNKSLQTSGKAGSGSEFVLDKVIFSNVFEKDIRRIYIYKKSERLAKAIHLITPAFIQAPSLRNRLEAIAVGLIDAATLPPASAREGLSRELLALSSFLSVARTGGLISEMNADLISNEAHLLLEEIAGYQEPRLFLEDMPSLAEFFKNAPRYDRPTTKTIAPQNDSVVSATPASPEKYKGHVSDISRTTPTAGAARPVTTTAPSTSDRQEAIVTILRSKGPSYIKDISTVIRDVSEKTIQRELQALVNTGRVLRSGERRWTQYYLPN